MPKDEQVDEHVKSRYKQLSRMLQVGLDECNQIIEGLNKKANATLAAGTVVLGIISAGWGIIFTALKVNDSITWNVVELSMWYEAISIIVGIVGFGLILWSIRRSLQALKIRTMESDFSSKMVLKNKKIDDELIEDWENEDELSMYRMECKNYAWSIQVREEMIESIAPDIRQSQRALIWGLVLSLAPTVAIVVKTLV